jgi:hypothetical protein
MASSSSSFSADAARGRDLEEDLDLLVATAGWPPEAEDAARCLKARPTTTATRIPQPKTLSATVMLVK